MDMLGIFSIKIISHLIIMQLFIFYVTSNAMTFLSPKMSSEHLIE